MLPTATQNIAACESEDAPDRRPPAATAATRSMKEKDNVQHHQDPSASARAEQGSPVLLDRCRA
jgi:hypothetical protein